MTLIEDATRRLHGLRADPLALVVLAIAVGTVVAGLVQLVVPGFVLGIIDADDGTTPEHLFAIIGMFMAVVGGAAAHSVWRDRAMRLVIGWAAVQKVGASIAVGLGVVDDVFGPLALLIAGFDLLSGVLMAVLARRSP